MRMASQRSDRSSDRRWRVAGVVGGLSLVAGLTSTARAEVQFLPRADLSAIWTDNYHLVPSNQPTTDQLILALVPGFSLVQSSPQLLAYLDYQLQGLVTEDNGTKGYNQGTLGAVYNAIPKWFSVRVGAQEAQYSVDPDAASNLNNLFQAGSTANATSGSVTPILLHDFKSLRVDAAYTVGVVRYSGAAASTTTSPLANSKNQDGHFLLGSVDPLAFVTWDANYRHQDVSYGNVQPFKDDDAEANIGLGVSSEVRLLGREGIETNPVLHSATGGLDASYWAAGVQWDRDRNNELRFLIGKRFFGRSFEGLWRHQARLLTYNVSYTESPTTEAQQLVLMTQPSTPTAPVPGSGFDQQFGRITSEAYLLKYLTGSVKLKARVTEITMFVESQIRTYIDTNTSDRIRGVGLDAARQLGPVLRAEVTGELDRVDGRGEIQEFQDQRYALILSRRIGLQSTAYLSLNHATRSGVAPAIYNVNWVVLGFHMGAPARAAQVPTTLQPGLQP
jgi:uncharacterized protein (PEP-CTERM system associated)